MKIKEKELINEQSIYKNKTFLGFFHFFYVQLSALPIIIGVFPHFLSLELLFLMIQIDEEHQNYKNIFLMYHIIYVTCIMLYIAVIASFITASYRGKVFIKKRTPLLMVLFCSVIMGALLINSLVFARFMWAGALFEVENNMFMWLIDLVIILPVYVCGEYFVKINITDKIRKIKKNLPEADSDKEE